MYVKILRKRGEIAPQEQFLLFSTIFCYLMLDFNVKTRIRFSLRDKRLFEITEVEITRVDCIHNTLQDNEKVQQSTKRRDKRGVHFNNTNSDFALEVSFSIYRSSVKKWRAKMLQFH